MKKNLLVLLIASTSTLYTMDHHKSIDDGTKQAEAIKLRICQNKLNIKTVKEITEARLTRLTTKKNTQEATTIKKMVVAYWLKQSPNDLIKDFSLQSIATDLIIDIRHFIETDNEKKIVATLEKKIKKDLRDLAELDRNFNVDSQQLLKAAEKIERELSGK